MTTPRAGGVSAPGLGPRRFETVVGAAVIGLEQAVQVRFAVGRSTYRRGSLPGLRPLRRRPERQRRLGRVRPGIPRARIGIEVARRLFLLSLAVILEDPVRALLAMERHADLPGPGEDLRILDRHLVLNGIGIAHRVPLDEFQRVAVEVARRVEPRLFVVVGHLDDERVAFPAAARIAHPRLEASVVRRPVRVNQPVDLRPFERHRDVIRASAGSETATPGTSCGAGPP